MPYWRLFYHLVWTTKRRHPLLTVNIEPIVYGYMRGKAIGLGGTVFAMGGVEDHVHLVVSIPPKLAIATFVGQVKGVAAARINKEHHPASTFRWQEEYGAFTFDGKRLPYVIDYVERQKQHHAQSTTITVLEQFEGQDGVHPVLDMVREERGRYDLDDITWRTEMHELS